LNFRRQKTNKYAFKGRITKDNNLIREAMRRVRIIIQMKEWAKKRRKNH
jgi:hypothetical protein